MAEPPRSSGSESVETFRNTLSKLLKDTSDVSPEEAKRRVFEVLVGYGGEEVPIERVAFDTGLQVRAVIAALDLPPNTPPEKVVRLKVSAEPPRRTPRGK
jgi:hypothetical protein